MAHRAWAVVRDGKIVISEVGLCEMLIFSKRWQAVNAALAPEEVRPVKIELPFASKAGRQSRISK